MIDENNDYGFSFSTEDDVTMANTIFASIQTQADDYRNRLLTINKVFMPLLLKLNSEPDKPMIRWPDRKDILDKQIMTLTELTNV